MPAKGKHRRTKSPRLTRSIAVAGTGGAALALPFLGATGASAAPAHTVPEKAVQSLPVSQDKAAEKNTGKNSAPRVYTVKRGDSLAKIAEKQNVAGGWKKLYKDNRGTIGDDPSLIHPGLKLAFAKKTGASPAKPPAKSPKPAEPSSASAQDTKPAAEPSAPASGSVLPVSGSGVGTAYKAAGGMWSSGYHTGVDFVVPTGTSLKAVGKGTVVSAGWAGAYGNQVVIDLGDGHYAQYGHLSSLSVSAGQSVTPGQEVGLSGTTGNSTGPHLHFEIRTTPDYGSDVDPMEYLRSHGAPGA
ncbi:MAG TPA: peptidoglycan DD-metalloendopeptidase family protein [Streptomyces sp.]|jgi:murein DD-endopeptidase MepM/ murein hydrolase activator NlpD|nr:peptidoglycan DD-metalloendopeptidase family protein [Streptomyces sp.]